MKKRLLAVAAIGIGLSLVAAPVFADSACDGVKTAVLGEGNCYSGGADGIVQLLSEIVDILTVGVGILAVIGITVVGIQYLTASGNEEKTRKAKRRILEIVIGLVVYVLIYGILKWLAMAQ